MLELMVRRLKLVGLLAAFFFAATLIGCGETTVRGGYFTANGPPDRDDPPDEESPFYLPCGTLNSSAVVTPIDYETYIYPGKGVSFAETSFGCKMTRLTEGLKDFNSGVHHSLAMVRPANHRATRFLVQNSSGLWAIIDRSGKIKVPENKTKNPRDPRWSKNDPFLLYDTVGNELVRYDVNFAKFDSASIKKFPQYTQVTYGTQADLGGSKDNSSLVLVGRLPDGNTEYFTFNILNGISGPQKPMPPFDGESNIPYLTPSGRIIVGNTIYDSSWKPEGLIPANLIKPESVFGRDLNGDDIMVTFLSKDSIGICAPETNGVVKFNIETRAISCLLPMNWDSAAISLSLSENGWLLLSTTDTKTHTAIETLPPNWASNWKPFMNELTLIRLDGIRHYRLAHHRSRPVNQLSAANPFAFPKAHLTPNAIYAIFDSNLGIPTSVSAPDYSDVVMIRVQK